MVGDCAVLPKPSRTGSRRQTDLREVLNAIRYMVRSGCEWLMLPVHFPPWQTVYWWFRRFVRLLLFRTIHDVVLMIDRERAGRSQQPSRDPRQSVYDPWLANPEFELPHIELKLVLIRDHGAIKNAWGDLKSAA
jgi:transposase